MDPGDRHRRLTRAQVAAVLAFALGVPALLLLGTLRDPEIPFLWPDGGAPWIADPMPLHTQGMWIDRASPRPRIFERRFMVTAPHGPLTLRVRALRALSLTLNGRAVDLAARDPRRWRDETVTDVTGLVVPGENVLRAEVRSASGAAILQLRLEGLSEPIETDARWQSARGGDPLEPARLADDGRPLPDALALPAPAPSLAANAVLLGAFFAAGAGAFLALRARPGLARAPGVASVAVALFWTVFATGKLAHLPAAAGFDGPGHVAYVRFLLERGALPLASDGFSMYHPPLFHVLAAALLAVARPTPDSVLERALLGLLPVLAAFAMALVAGAAARRLRPGEPLLEAGAVLAGGLLPMSVALGACVSNEAPHALIASLAVLAALVALTRPSATMRDDLALGALLGAALLTKYTSIVLVPILVGALAVKRVLVDGARWTHAVHMAAHSLAVTAALAGWLYARNWLHFGDPFVWSLDVDPARTFWQLPGFHTPGYFLRFGEALAHPWFAGFVGFWDSLYTTLWGDGLLGGASGAAAFHGAWRLDLMAAGYLLALPATALLAVGWLRAGRIALRDPDLGRRLAYTLVVALPPVFLASLVSVNLRLPFWSLGKAFYALCLTPVAALLLALGFDALDGALARRATPLVRALPWGWAAAFAGTIVLAFLG